MELEKFIRKDYVKIDAYQGTNSIKKYLAKESALVVNENNKYVGLLTRLDLINRNYQLVIDCLSTDYRIDSHDSVEGALKLMREKNIDVLSVLNDEEFIGIIKKDDILDYFEKSSLEKNSIIKQLLHDIKNPIFAVKSIADLLNYSCLSEDDRVLFDSSKNSILSALSILDNAELYLKDAVSRKETINLVSFIKDRLFSYKGLIQEKELKVKLLYNSRNVDIDFPLNDLTRVLDNIFSNSAKFVPKKGTIRFRIIKKSKTKILLIRDYGIGIPNVLVKELFKEKSKAARFGLNGEKPSGLGLYIVKKLMNKNNGQIVLGSIEGKGTLIQLIFFE